MIPTSFCRQIIRRVPKVSLALVDEHTATAVRRAWPRWVKVAEAGMGGGKPASEDLYCERDSFVWAPGNHTASFRRSR